MPISDVILYTLIVINIVSISAAFMWKVFNKMTSGLDLAKLGPKPQKFILNGGWLKMSGHEVEVVKAIKKVAGLEYHYRKGDDYNGIEETVYVTNEVGTAIELYVRGQGYADMSLDEFLLKTLFSKLTGQINENTVGSRDKDSHKPT